MITVSPVSTTRVDIALSGDITRSDMEALLTDLDKLTATMDKGHMLFQVNDFHWPSLGAITFELTHLRAFFKAYKHFERIAVICEKGWIRNVSEWEGHLLPWVDIAAFVPDEKELAEHWLTHGDTQQAA